MRLRVAIVAVLVPLVLWGLLPMLSEGSAPTAKLGNVQRKIDITRTKIGKRKGTERVLSTQIGGYSQRIGRLQGSIGKLESRQQVAESDLSAKRDELYKLQDDLRTQRRRLVRLKARLAQARTALAQRLTELYQADAPDLVTVILSSKGFSQLLERGEFMQRISQQDQQIIRVVRSAKTDATSLSKKLAKLEARQQKVTQIVQQRRDEIAQVKQGLINTRVGLAGTRADKRNALSNVRSERAQLEGNLSDLKAQQAKIKATLQQAAGSLPAGAIKKGNGSMIWPVNGPITSQFCERRAWEACHPGIDIGVPSGTPIRAAAGGKVTLQQSVGASGGYGNYTCISHTSTLSTCYAHQSAFKVSLGQSVSQGQVIGISGCTGLCFGPHLHFEVRINGSVTNPLNYL